MIISLVVAASTNHVIGKNNRLLWHLPNDLKFFKNTTWGMPVVMGRKTFEAVGKPLTGRTNIVITHSPAWRADGVSVAGNFTDAIAIAAATDAKEMYVIGGGEIYRQSLPLAHKIYLTRVHTILDGDTFFPEISDATWKLHSSMDFPSDEKHAFSYTFEVWINNKNVNVRTFI
ncbi:MAG TPA: dihydrofolate reductase [Flavitalea sp.]|nr:dihydrofolate reductase [Flavitalea sp.]